MPTWIAIKARVECPECGSPVMLNGPWREMRCPACHQITNVEHLWPELIDRADKYGGSGTHFTVRTMFVSAWSTPNVYYAVNAGSPPLCSKCDRRLDEAGAIPDGVAGAFPCPGCGTVHPTWPGPEHQGRPTQVFMAPKDSGADAPAAPATSTRPVIFGCPNCGANLNVGLESPRLLPCGYCEVDVFLPQELWNQLHPVRRRQAFWIRR